MSMPAINLGRMPAVARSLVFGRSLRNLAALTAGCLMLGAALAEPATAEPFEGCPSNDIRARFEEFGRTGKMPPDMGAWLSNPKAQYIEPWKAFDNVYYVGICWVSAWAIRTSDGVVLIDTLHEPHVDQLIANLRRVGVDLAEIKYVLMTHGHFDHVGGAAKLKPLLPNAKFVMTQTGWNEAIEAAKKSEATPRPWSMIAQDVVAKGGDMIRVGDNSFGVEETPGHTHGTASYTYDVKDGAKTYRAITVGGLGLNAIENSKQVEEYIASIDKIAEQVKRPTNPVTVHLTTHPFSNGLTELREKVLARKAGEPNPLVDPKGLLEQLAYLRKGAEERLDAERKAGR
ncbi:MBL fold metallo-hydrolase [Bradyrhizobium sp. SRS-191]|uniref:MBL fold metallo-hydrolase n=1 Tax=Bradyrhizobium sp. SRS-191 TaxID=2962606 RepID=UPI00211EA37C|nr:MBL fold metallo-hydrolase [Bradyrhizobium sp. SRS-191]